MENFNKFKINLDYNNENNIGREELHYLEHLLDGINRCFDDDNESFYSLCYYISELKSFMQSKIVYDTRKEMYQFDTIMRYYGLNETAVSRIISSYNKYFVRQKDKNGFLQSYKIMEVFEPFNKSKLFELLVIPTEQLIHDIETKILRPDMSVKTIRQYVKNYKAQLKLKDEQIQKEEKKENEEIPMVYDPKKFYDFSYFENKSKLQLLNMIWDLQKAYQELKKQKNK